MLSKTNKDCRLALYVYHFNCGVVIIMAEASDADINFGDNL